MRLFASSRDLEGITSKPGKRKPQNEKKEQKKAKMEKRKSIKQLVTEVNPGKSAEEPITAYVPTVGKRKI